MTSDEILGTVRDAFDKLSKLSETTEGKANELLHEAGADLAKIHDALKSDDVRMEPTTATATLNALWNAEHGLTLDVIAPLEALEHALFAYDEMCCTPFTTADLTSLCQAAIANVRRRAAEIRDEISDAQDALEKFGQGND